MRTPVALLVALSGCSFAPAAGPTDAQHDAPLIPVDGEGVPDTSAPGRVRDGLISVFAFDEGSGSTVTDIPPAAGSAVTLTIGNPTTVAWGSGALALVAPAIVASPASVQSPIFAACKKANALTVEAWVRPASMDQDGKSGQFARVVTGSTNAGSRNFSLGQHGTAWALEARTTAAGVDGQGAPILAGGTVGTGLTYVAMTVGPTTRRLYVDGQLVASDNLGGALTSWMAGYRLGLGAEPSGSNPWLGTFELVAFYDRELADTEIATNYQAGADAR